MQYRRPVLLTAVAAWMLDLSFFIFGQQESFFAGTYQFKSKEKIFFRDKHNVRDLSMTHYPSLPVSYNNWWVLWLHFAPTSTLYFLCLQSLTLAATGHISKYKRTVDDVSGDSLWCSLHFHCDYLANRKVIRHRPNMFTSSTFLSLYPWVISSWGYKRVCVSVNGLSQHRSNCTCNM